MISHIVLQLNVRTEPPHQKVTECATWRHEKVLPELSKHSQANDSSNLVALVCSEPTAGRERWTLELLTQRMIDDEHVAELSPETVRLTLKNQLMSW